MRMKDHEWIINTWLVNICMCTSMSSRVWACGGISILPIKLSICAGRSFKTTYPKCCPVQNTIPKLNPNCKRLQEAKHIGTYQCWSTPKHGRLHDGYVQNWFYSRKWSAFFFTSQNLPPAVFQIHLGYWSHLNADPSLLPQKRCDGLPSGNVLRRYWEWPIESSSVFPWIAWRNMVDLSSSLCCWFVYQRVSHHKP